MKTQVSIGSALLGGALATIATSVAKHVWGAELPPDLQSAIQTVFVTLTVAAAKLIEAVLAKYKINFEVTDKQEGDGK